MSDAERIRADARAGSRAVVVGMGFVGPEVAASLRQLGLEVTVVEMSPVPLAHVFGEEIGRVLEAIHRDQGVQMVLGDGVAAFDGADRVESVLTRSGRRIQCDSAVVGLGIEPETGLLSGTDISVDNGVVVDEFSRTSVEGIFAAGDVANHAHPVLGRHVRVEHWQNALKQGAAAARSMIGRGHPYDEIHWFWSDQYDVNIQYAGFHTSWDALIIRGNPADRNFLAFYLNGDRIDAAVSLNRARELRRTIPLIKAHAPVDPTDLHDEAIDLGDLGSDPPPNGPRPATSRNG